LRAAAARRGRAVQRLVLQRVGAQQRRGLLLLRWRVGARRDGDVWRKAARRGRLGGRRRRCGSGSGRGCRRRRRRRLVREGLRACAARAAVWASRRVSAEKSLVALVRLPLRVRCRAALRAPLLRAASCELRAVSRRGAARIRSSAAPCAAPRAHTHEAQGLRRGAKKRKSAARHAPLRPCPQKCRQAPPPPPLPAALRQAAPPSRCCVCVWCVVSHRGQLLLLQREASARAARAARRACFEGTRRATGDGARGARRRAPEGRTRLCEQVRERHNSSRNSAPRRYGRGDACRAERCGVS
jgi:hypothetical protein